MKTTISFDGDGYQMIIPSTKKLDALMEYLWEKHDLTTMMRFQGPILTGRCTDGYTYEFCGSSSTGHIPVGTWNNTRPKPCNSHTLLCLQPILMPVKSNSDECFKLSEKDFPTGTIIHGGSVACCDQVCSFPASLDNGQVTWADSDKETMDFIVFNQMYWCLKPIVFGTLQQIFENWSWIDA